MFEEEAKERAEKLEENQTLGVYDNEEDYERAEKEFDDWFNGTRTKKALETLSD